MKQEKARERDRNICELNVCEKSSNSQNLKP